MFDIIRHGTVEARHTRSHTEPHVQSCAITQTPVLVVANGSVAPPSWMRYRWPTTVGCPAEFDRYTSNSNIRHICDLPL